MDNNGHDTQHAPCGVVTMKSGSFEQEAPSVLCCMASTTPAGEVPANRSTRRWPGTDRMGARAVPDSRDHSWAAALGSGAPAHDEYLVTTRAAKRNTKERLGSVYLPKPSPPPPNVAPARPCNLK